MLRPLTADVDWYRFSADGFGMAKRSGYQQITLTTFRTVPWNMRFYTRLGFVEIPTHELRPELETVVRDEGSRGLDREQRVVMRYLMNVSNPCLDSELCRELDEYVISVRRKRYFVSCVITSFGYVGTEMEK